MNITHVKGTVPELEDRGVTIFLRSEGLQASTSSM